jgi:hypothetical protein
MQTLAPVEILVFLGIGYYTMGPTETWNFFFNNFF